MKPRAMAGVGLIEVLVTMLIIAVGMLGIATLQARAQQAEIEAYQRSQALILVDDMVGRIETNRALRGCYVTDGFVGSGVAATPCSGYAASTQRDRADADLGEWVAALDGAAEEIDGALVGSIVGARGCVTADADLSVFTVTVAWQGRHPVPPSDNPCGQGAYESAPGVVDDRLRRVASMTFRVADLVSN